MNDALKSFCAALARSHHNDEHCSHFANHGRGAVGVVVEATMWPQQVETERPGLHCDAPHLERNRRTFDNGPANSINQLFHIVITEGQFWVQAGAKRMAAVGWPQSQSA